MTHAPNPAEAAAMAAVISEQLKKHYPQVNYGGPGMRWVTEQITTALIAEGYGPLAEARNAQPAQDTYQAVDFTSVLKETRAQYEAHPHWKRLVGTPWENDAAVIAADMACRLVRKHLSVFTSALRSEAAVEAGARAVATLRTAAYADPAIWTEDLEMQRRHAVRGLPDAPITIARAAVDAAIKSAGGGE
jgi:hypothetical protein